MLAAALLLSSAGCNFLANSSNEPTGENGDQDSALPGWLLLAHRSAEDPDAADNEVAFNLKTRDDEEENGLEEDLGDNTTGTPGTEESSQPAPAPSQPAPSQSGNTSDEGTGDMPKPGTMEYIIWKKQLQDEAAAAKEQEKDDELDWWEKESNEDTGWW